MDDIINQYWGKGIFISSLKDFSGIVKLQKKNKEGGIEYIDVGSISSGILNIQLPKEQELLPYFGRHYLSIKNDIIQKYIYIDFLDIFESGFNTRIDQLHCVFRENEIEDSLWFRYSDKEMTISSERTETTLEKGYKYIEKQIEDFNLHIGWNVIWTHKESSDNEHHFFFTHQTDLKNMPDNIMWRCLNH
jgi:hypothetical protein